MSCQEYIAALILQIIEINWYLPYILTLLIYHNRSCVTLTHFVCFFSLTHTHTHKNTGRLHPSMNLADLSSRAESRCTCVLAHSPKVCSAHLLECTCLYTQGGHLLVLSSTPFAAEVPGCRVMDEVLKKPNVSSIYSADPLIFTEDFLFTQAVFILYIHIYRSAALIQIHF